ncbi:MAG: acetyl-CoA carboxylase biotin carboxyl carrier protein [Planctomycetota bacterium]
MRSSRMGKIDRDGNHPRDLIVLTARVSIKVETAAGSSLTGRGRETTMDLEQLERLMALMNENDLCEVEIETEEQRIRLKKSGADTVVMAPAPQMMAPATPLPNAAMASPGPEDITAVEGNSLTFNSPMVGTFYSSSSPTSDPFVAIGTKVGASTVLCIIEAMKVMNEITADMEGEVTEVLVANGEAVEYGQPLFTIKPR